MDIENKKTIKDDVIDETKDVERTELLIALPALIENIKNELHLSEEILFSLNNELSISILENDEVKKVVEKIEDLFIGNTEEPIIDTIIEKIVTFFDNKESILSPNDTDMVSDAKDESTIVTTSNNPEVQKDILLKKMQESFVKPTSLAPTTRDHSAPPASAPAPSTPRPIDPYRELPDEK